MTPAADLNFMFDRAAECMPRADLAALQLSRLKSQLEFAYAKVPHVRAKFDAAGVTPATLKSLDDIRRFPFTTKTDMRDTYPFGLFAVPREQVVRLHASSGTTGKATVVGYTQRDVDLWSGLMARCMTGRNRIKALLPTGTPVEHKTGTLSGYTSDVGFITLPDGRRIAVALFARSSGDRPRTIAQAARAIYDGFNAVLRSPFTTAFAAP